MSERINRPQRTAAEEISDLVLRPEDKGWRRIPLEVKGVPHAVEFIDTLNSLVIGLWSYRPTPYPGDNPENLEGAIKFTKDTDEIRVKYDSLDSNDLRYFAEGLTADREIEPDDLPVWQGIIEKTLKEIKND